MYSEYKWSPVAHVRNGIMRNFEPLQPFILLELANALSADTFIDVGANIGAYSVFFLRLPGVKEIHAFEPSPKTFIALQETVAANSLEGRITCHNEALSDKNEMVVFRVVSDFSGANGISSSTIHSKRDFLEETRVRAVRLDDALQRSGHSICLKIDVEGHEVAVLAGAKQLLASNECVVQIEAYANKGTSNDTGGFLRECGYQPFLRIGPDNYFTNNLERFPPGVIQGCIERAADMLIADSKKLGSAERSGRNARRTVVPGVTLELSGTPLNAVRRLSSLFGKSAKR